MPYGFDEFILCEKYINGIESFGTIRKEDLNNFLKFLN